MLTGITNSGTNLWVRTVMANGSGATLNCMVSLTLPFAPLHSTKKEWVPSPSTRMAWLCLLAGKESPLFPFSRSAEGTFPLLNARMSTRSASVAVNIGRSFSENLQNAKSSVMTMRLVAKDKKFDNLK